MYSIRPLSTPQKYPIDIPENNARVGLDLDMDFCRNIKKQNQQRENERVNFLVPMVVYGFLGRL